MRWLFVLLLTTPVTTGIAHAQRAPDNASLPDSSYLLLTLELPIFGSFQMTQVGSGFNARRRLIMHEIRSVEVVGCMLRWRHFTRTHDDSRSTRTPMMETQVPLKAIDLKRVNVRPALAPPGNRFEPPAYEVVTYALDRRARPITTRNLENEITTKDWQATLRIGLEDEARRVSDTLVDAARRCDTWRTAPLPVIR